MNTTLRNLLVVVGVAGAGAATIIYTPRAGVTRTQLGAAGIGADCVRRDRVCQFYGDACPNGGYCRRRFDVAVCPEGDGGLDIIVPRAVAANLRQAADEAWCGAPGPSTVAADAVVDEPFSCACSTGAACEALVLAPDGTTSWQDAPKTGDTLGEGRWRGEGCVPKACVELAGVPSAPPGCAP